MFRKSRLAVLITCMLVISLLAGCTQQAPTSDKTPADDKKNTQSIEKTADVVVIGGGLAGLSAAISAVDNGANVILLEKMSFTGGASMLSGGAMLAAESHIQKEHGMDQTKDELEAYWYEQQAKTPAPEGYPNKEFVRMIIDEAPETIKFAEDNGVKFVKPSSFYPETRDRLHDNEQKSGAGLTGPLTESAKEKGAEVLLNTEATKLIEKDGAIVGVIAKDKDGNEIIINAKSVILANGGFSRNAEMMDSVEPTSAKHISVSGVGNVGDGYRMAEEVGADFHEEDWIIGLRSQAVEGKSALNGLSWTTGLYVNLEGERFSNENAPYSVLYNNTTLAEIVDYFLIFDSSMSQMLEPELEGNKEILFKGENIEELAKATKMDAEELKATVERYNELAKKGVDEDFGKQPELMVPLGEGPMYALKVRATQMGTMGGVKTTKNMEVLNANGDIIPGLFAAGEMANRPFYGRVYVTGSSLQIAATTGRIAGVSATK
ncbi:FAD-dependent oxidoreductase [Alkaliphilus sp. MSJ-5]|uniref:FAD-dependent oxidoreductase n=1 Tax=Alkaliphilus flagellatus TaxID=2841507 RepID=A0ABS6G5H3_9FIRM|nr:FAD-dependent oxidoreductase [Alkaliphilus flagellatus]MBU5676621.1 FAD-dependent oxidoreductase [Alkaliphilus flagellatus]